MPLIAHHSSLDALRTEIRDFLQSEIPEDICEAVRTHCLVTREQAQRWQRILHRRGWAAPGWPREHGGTGWSLLEQAVFREEYARSDAPRFENLGVDTIGPTLIRHGTPEQQARFLPGILSFDDYWAQGYSEPDAGSDLASLRTTARREGDHYIVSGTKIWQSYGHWANWALVLVRSDTGAARKQDGISVLLIDLASPGVTVRPIRFINGALFHVQLFFDEVRVPVDQLVGHERQGWSVAKDLLVIERLFVARVAECKAEVTQTVALAAGRAARGTSLLADDAFARRHAELDIRARAVEAAWWPAVRAAEAGTEADAEASLLKLQGTELLQDIFSLQLEAIGMQGLPFDPMAVEGRPNPTPFAPGQPENLPLHFFRYRGITLGAGTSEVQRQIVAKAIFSGASPLERQDVTGLSEQQTMIDSALRRFLHDRYSFDQRRAIVTQAGGFDGSVWASLSELGLMGLMVPERDGGFGGAMPDLLPVMESLGEALVLEPYLWCAVLARQILLNAPEGPARARLLGSVIGGSLRLALAFQEDGGHLDLHDIRTQARRDGTHWRIDGVKRYAMGGDQAHHFIVSARLEGGGIGLFVIAGDAPGLHRRHYLTHDGRGAADLHLDQVALAEQDLLAGPERACALLEEALAIGTVALCAEAVGAMRRALALTVEYLRTRKQFGRSLSDYQALQHRIVEHYRGWTNARSLVREAAEGFSAAPPAEQVRRVSAAKWMVGQAGRAIGLDALQLHGAVGLQDETAISHYSKRLIMTDLLLGSASTHLGRFVEASREDWGVGSVNKSTLSCEMGLPVKTVSIADVEDAAMEHER